MNEIVNAQYKVVQERTLPVIASEIIVIEQTVGRVAMEGAIEIGQHLEEAKELVEHGEWENWCEENLNYSKRKAERFMKIAKEYGDKNSIYSKTTTLSDLSISKALALLSVPEEEVEKFVEDTPISEISTKELEDEIKRLKDKAAKDEVEIEQLKSRSENKEEIEKLKSEIEELKAGGADDEEIKRLQAEIEKEKDKQKKIKEELAKEKATREAAIEESLKTEKENIRAEAEKEAAEKYSDYDNLQAEIDSLNRKIAAASNDSILRFKIMVDQLQEMIGNCKAVADEAEEPEKLKAALKTLIISEAENL